MKRVDKIEHFSEMINAKMDKLIERWTFNEIKLQTNIGLKLICVYRILVKQILVRLQTNIDKNFKQILVRLNETVESTLVSDRQREQMSKLMDDFVDGKITRPASS